MKIGRRPLTSFEDFTVFPRGLEVPLVGRVEICPACGRNGIAARPECGDPYFLHRQLCEVLADGMRIEPFDSCALKPN